MIRITKPQLIILSVTLIIIAFLVIHPVSASKDTESQQINQELRTHQSYANNDPGNYDYAKFIKRINYTGRNRIIVVVNNRFHTMSSNDKNSIMNQVQGLSIQVLQEDNLLSPKQASKGLLITIRDNQKVIGKSDIHHPYKYHWR